MNNTYDLLVNFRSNAYQFYEWQKNDDITSIKSIPCIKVFDKTLSDFINNNIKVSNSFLNMIKNKTISNKMIKYACVLFNSEIALAFIFTEDGRILKKSNLIFDESDDIVDKFCDLKETSIKYKITDSPHYDNTKTRNENKLIRYVTNYLESVSNKEEIIKYLYYECFTEYENNYTKAYKKLVSEVKKENSSIIYKLNKIITLIKK